MGCLLGGLGDGGVSCPKRTKMSRIFQEIKLQNGPLLWLLGLRFLTSVFSTGGLFFNPFTSVFFLSVTTLTRSRFLPVSFISLYFSTPFFWHLLDSDKQGSKYLASLLFPPTLSPKAAPFGVLASRPIPFLLISLCFLFELLSPFLFYPSHFSSVVNRSHGIPVWDQAPGMF